MQPTAQTPNKKKRSRRYSKTKKILRSVRLLLLPGRDTEQRLFKLCDISMRAYNELNYKRRQQFFSKQGIDFEGTYKKIRSKYTSEIGSATIQQVLNKSNEDWKAFFGLLKAKNEGRLPPFIEKVSPPGYKDRKNISSIWESMYSKLPTAHTPYHFYYHQPPYLLLPTLYRAGWIIS